MGSSPIQHTLPTCYSTNEAGKKKENPRAGKKNFVDAILGRVVIMSVLVVDNQSSVRTPRPAIMEPEQVPLVSFLTSTGGALCKIHRASNTREGSHRAAALQVIGFAYQNFTTSIRRTFGSGGFVFASSNFALRLGR